MGLRFVLHKPEKIDEHDLPTEPLPDLVFAQPDQPDRDKLPDQHTTVSIPSSTNNPAFYPALPGMSTGGGALQVEAGKIKGPGSLFRQLRMWPQLLPMFALRLLPLGVGLCFVGLQLLLLLRFGLKIWSPTQETTWMNAVYVSSDLALLPFHLLLPPLQQEVFTRIEPYTLLAVIIYGLCSRMFVHLLKIIVSAYLAAGTRAEADIHASKLASRTD
ncbi:hypothetical protein KDA_08080 [Dictyobacter alpinus]|uniref:YggT family protein n=1 Tax=Dictyobacter alpinus TaxID=2014873 RepID=A0A402B1U0_9CHLR|nr:hypothetical protein [Dictyobacter alpinus]GCE25324.1 hypothetical protein KDA_08080 [Dictyobacter alpinus]